MLSFNTGIYDTDFATNFLQKYILDSKIKK